MADTLPAPFDVKLMNWTASALFLLCAVAVLAAGAWWVLRNPAFAIGSIVVQGDLSHNNAVTLRANAASRLQGNFFTVNLGQAREVFESVPWVRRATVRREFPNQLRVQLQEHRAAALWGPEDQSAMVNSFGEVFEANVGDVDQDDLPRLHGPQAQAPEVLRMYHRLAPLFGGIDMELDELWLSPRGGWRGRLDGGALVEFGSGTPDEVEAVVRRFVQTLTQVTSKYGRRVDALESADLRHNEGYALRLRGVTTLVPDAVAKPSVKPAAPKPAAARRP